MKKLCLLLAALFAPSVGAAYKCVDEKGVTHIGDTPPVGCATVVMYEVTPTGIVLRKIDPTPTAEQLKVRLEEQERKKEADRVAGEQKRKDLALLSSFAAEREFDVARDRNVEPLQVRIRSAQDRIKAVDKRIQEVEEEMEFYKEGKSKAGQGRRPPMVLTHEQSRLRAEKAVLEKSIVTHEKEIEELKAKFDTDKKRWLALKSGAVAKPPEFIPQDPKPEPPPPSRRRY